VSFSWLLGANFAGMSTPTIHEARESLLGEKIPWEPRLDRQLRRDVARVTSGRPGLQEAINSISRLHPALADAVAGVWCGRSGRISIPVGTGNLRIVRSLVVGWEGGVVEFAYLA